MARVGVLNAALPTMFSWKKVVTVEQWLELKKTSQCLNVSSAKSNIENIKNTLVENASVSTVKCITRKDLWDSIDVHCTLSQPKLAKCLLATRTNT